MRTLMEVVGEGGVDRGAMAMGARVLPKWCVGDEPMCSADSTVGLKLSNGLASGGDIRLAMDGSRVMMVD